MCSKDRHFQGGFRPNLCKSGCQSVEGLALAPKLLAGAGAVNRPMELSSLGPSLCLSEIPLLGEKGAMLWDCVRNE